MQFINGTERCLGRATSYDRFVWQGLLWGTVIFRSDPRAQDPAGVKTGRAPLRELPGSQVRDPTCPNPPTIPAGPTADFRFSALRLTSHDSTANRLGRMIGRIAIALDTSCRGSTRDLAKFGFSDTTDTTAPRKLLGNCRTLRAVPPNHPHPSPRSARPLPT